VKGITSESFVPESLILPQDVPALCDDPGLRTAVLASLPTLDESGMAIRQTGGRDLRRGIQIPGVPAGGPQSAGAAPSALAAALRPLDKGKGAAGSSSAPSGTGGLEEERRRQLRRADGSLVSDPPSFWTPPEASEDSWWGRGGRLLGPGRIEARQSSATTTIGSTATAATTIVGPVATTTT
jgi:hypothetical protein